MQTISHKPTCALSQFKHWLIRRNVRVIDSWDCCSQFLLVEGVRRHLSLVAKTQYCAVMVSQSPSSHPSNSCVRRVTGRECPLISCVMRLVLTSAESAVMHIISADTIKADTILSIRYTFQYDSDPIIVRSLIWTVNRLAGPFQRG